MIQKLEIRGLIQSERCSAGASSRLQHEIEGFPYVLFFHFWSACFWRAWVFFLSPGAHMANMYTPRSFFFFPLHPMDWSAQQSRPAYFLYFFLRFMLGWNNPLPIGQSMVVSLGGGGKRYSQSRPHPVAIATQGPGSHPYIYRSRVPLGVGAFEVRHNSPSHLQARYSSGSLFFPPTTPHFILRPHCHLGRYR